MGLKYKKGPDGGWGWFVVLGSFIIHIIIDGIIYTTGIFMDPFITEFKCSQTLANAAVQLLCGTSLIIGPLAGALTNAWGCRLVGVVGSLVAAIGLVLTAVSTNIYTVIIAFGVITGSGLGLLYVSSIVILSLYFRTKLARATGIASSGSGIGTILFAPLVDRLTQSFGWRQTMVALAVVTSFCLPCSWLFRPLLKKRVPKGFLSTSQETTKMAAGEVTSSDVEQNNQLENEQKEKSADEYETTAITTSEILKESFAEMLGPEALQDFNFIVFTSSSFFISLGFLVPYVYSTKRALELKVASESEASLLISVIGIGSTIGRLLFGYLSDLTCVNRLYIYITMATLTGAITMASIFLTSYTQLALYCFSFGLLTGGAIAMTSVVITDLFEVHRVSNVFGLLSLFEGIACSLPITGWLFEQTGSVNGSFLVAGGCYMAGGLILTLITIRQRKLKNQETKLASNGNQVDSSKIE
ncbi:Monocarboxylate transporter 14 [Halotydeus destructor]|nr:Monocarboxylate transporter 14 [Halotydeus destructor]